VPQPTAPPRTPVIKDIKEETWREGDGYKENYFSLNLKAIFD
jgi:hypothetical protein